jgi:hypothetical protein
VSRSGLDLFQMEEPVGSWAGSSKPSIARMRAISASGILRSPPNSMTRTSPVDCAPQRAFTDAQLLGSRGDGIAICSKPSGCTSAGRACAAGPGACLAMLWGLFVIRSFPLAGQLTKIRGRSCPPS